MSLTQFFSNNYDKRFNGINYGQLNCENVVI